MWVKYTFFTWTCSQSCTQESENKIVLSLPKPSLPPKNLLICFDVDLQINHSISVTWAHHKTVTATPAIWHRIMSRANSYHKDTNTCQTPNGKGFLSFRSLCFLALSISWKVSSGKVPTSHVALEVALETKPNLLLLTEEVASKSASSCCCKTQWKANRPRRMATTETQETSTAAQLDRWKCRAMLRTLCTRWMITATICGKLSAASQMTDPEFAFPSHRPWEDLKKQCGFFLMFVLLCHYVLLRCSQNIPKSLSGDFSSGGWW